MQRTNKHCVVCDRETVARGVVKLQRAKDGPCFVGMYDGQVYTLFDSAGQPVHKLPLRHSPYGCLSCLAFRLQQEHRLSICAAAALASGELLNCPHTSFDLST